MLRDDAIRQGLLKPTKADIERMNLSKKELDEAKSEPEEKKKAKTK